MDRIAQIRELERRVAQLEREALFGLGAKTPEKLIKLMRDAGIAKDFDRVVDQTIPGLANMPNGGRDSYVIKSMKLSRGVIDLVIETVKGKIFSFEIMRAGLKHHVPASQEADPSVYLKR